MKPYNLPSSKDANAISTIPSLGSVFEKLVWTVEDVADALGVSVRHVYKLISMDRIPYSKIGRRTVFVRSQITEWLHKGGTK